MTPVLLLATPRLLWSLASLLVAPALVPDEGFELWVFGATEIPPAAPGVLRVVARLSPSALETAPMAGAEVEVWLDRGAGDRLRLVAGRTDAHGGYEARIRLPANAAEGQAELEVLVRGPAGALSARRRLVSRPAARLALQLGRDVAEPGEELQARLVLLTSPGRRPLVGSSVRLRLLTGEGRELSVRELESGSGGVATARFALPAQGRWIRVRAEADAAAPAERWVRLGPSDPADAGVRDAPEAPALELVGTSGRVPSGASVRVRIRGPAALGVAFLEVRQDGRSLASHTVPLAAGQATADLVLDPTWEGPLELVALGLGPCGRIWSARSALWVEPAEKLEVTVVRWQPIEHAGEPARLRLEVRDAAGRPRAAWLAVTAMAAEEEEALPAAGWDGAEVLPSTSRVEGWATETALRWQADPACVPDRLAQLWPPAGVELHAPRVKRIAVALSRYGEENRTWFRVDVWDPLRAAWAPPADVLDRLPLRGLLPAEELRDAWDRPLALAALPAPRGAGPLRFLALRSLGPDGRPGGADDLELPLGVAGGEPAPAPPPAPCAPGRLVLFAPALATDAQGALELSLPLPAEGSACWLQVLAHSADGGAGLVHHRIELKPR